LYARSALETLLKTLVGGGLGVGGGFLVAVAVAHVRWFRRMVLPYLIALRVVPKVALAPVFLLYVGLGFGTAVGFVALLTFFPMTISTAAGFKRVPDHQRELLRSVDAAWLSTLLAVELPYALPDVLAGLKQSVVLAVVGAVVAEWLLEPSGLGYLVLVGSESVQMTVVLGAVVVLVCLSVALYGFVTLLQRRLSWT
jgi:NitT/TauT family transport system permease protein